ncbi:hypothetical protein Fcan01_02520 [Folsomia candida]|uniref:Uncharacterized protein n=1 Tax=Folsomia candida TaxID=158441 RepID=A0A226F1X8_FOLCA|nr:hypothetical protein Fcan01_02520 [Folsomia candida]
MSVVKMKQFESGEEFIFDGITKIPIFGIAYGVPRSLAYASMGNKKQMMNSIRGVAENGAGVLKLIATPLTAPIGSRSNSRLIRKPIKAKLGNMIRLMASSAFFPPGSNLVPTAANMKSRLAITITFECIELQGIFAGIDDKLVLFRSSNNTFSNDKRLTSMYSSSDQVSVFPFLGTVCSSSNEQI